MARTTVWHENTEEKILTLVKNISRKTGFLKFGNLTYNMVITDRRLIFALVTRQVQQLMKKELDRLRQRNKEQGRGFFSSWRESITAGMTWYDRYLYMDPEESLAESPDNFYIEKPDIISLKVTNLTGMEQTDNNAPRSFFRIRTGREKYKFMLPRNYDPGPIKTLKKWGRST